MFVETRNVYSALQAVGPHKQPNRRQCNVTAGSACILLISNEVQPETHYNTRVGCDLEAPVKGGGIQKLDRVNGITSGAAIWA